MPARKTAIHALIVVAIVIVITAIAIVFNLGPVVR